MRYLRPTLVVLLLSASFFPLKIKGENNVTAGSIADSIEVSRENENREEGLSENEIVLEKWRQLERTLKDVAPRIVKSILRYVINFSHDTRLSSKCTNSLMKMLYGIKELKLWAFQMIDSSGKIGNGLLNGHLSSLGDFDGCLAVTAPGPNPFRGQYCSVFIKAPLPKRERFLNMNKPLPLFANFSKKGQVVQYMASMAQHFYRVSLRTSLCVPSTCSREDIQTIADTYATYRPQAWNMTIPTCDVLEPLVFSKSDIAIICVLSVIGLLAFTATVVDVVLNTISKAKRLKAESSSTALQCLMCFSTYSNTLRLLKKDTSPDSIKIFHGIKFITLLWVMLNHTYYFMNFNTSGDLKVVKRAGTEIAFQVIINGFLNVETFFFVSAVLVAYGRMKFAGEHISIPLYIFRRVWRITPPLMLVIATSMLVPHMGSGPGWKETVVDLIDKCKANWFTNLIFINNFIKVKDQCFEWLWYVPVDLHLYILALPVVIPMKSRPRLAFSINALLFAGGIVASVANHIYYKLPPTSIYAFHNPDDIHYFIGNSYFRSYTHITTYCIGLCVGYILATRPKVKIPVILNIIGWLSSIILSLVVLYGVFEWNKGNVPGLAVSTLYAFTSKIVWALALGYVTIACYTGNGGAVTSLLSWSAFVPLARLTYVCYLIHPIFLYMDVGSTRVPIHANHKILSMRFLQNILTSYSFAYLISLLFESPFMGLEKVMFSRRRVPKVSLDLKPEQNGKFNKKPKFVDTAVSVIRITKIANEYC